MAYPTKPHSSEEQLALLNRVLHDWEKQTPKQKVAIAQTFQPQFKGSKLGTTEGFVTFLNKVVEEEKRPAIQKRRGGKLLPKWAVDELAKPLTAGEPTERRQFAEEVAEERRLKAIGKKPSLQKGFSALWNLFESGAPIGAVRPRAMRKTMPGRSGTEPVRTTRPSLPLKPLELDRAIQQDGWVPQSDIASRYATLTIPKNLEKTANDVWGAYAKNTGKVWLPTGLSPANILKEFYPDLKNKADADAAIEMEARMNQFRPGSRRVRLGDLLEPVHIRVVDWDPKLQDALGTFSEHTLRSTGKKIKVITLPRWNPKTGKPQTPEQLFTTLVHELRHAYDLPSKPTLKSRLKNVKQKYINAEIKDAEARKSTWAKRHKIKKGTEEYKEIAEKALKHYEAQIELEASTPSALRVPKSKLPAGRVWRTKAGEQRYLIEQRKTHEALQDITYRYTHEEVGPNFFGPINQVAARMGFRLESRKEIRRFVDYLRKNAHDRKDFFDVVITNQGQEPLAAYVGKKIELRTEITQLTKRIRELIKEKRDRSAEQLQGPSWAAEKKLIDDALSKLYDERQKRMYELRHIIPQFKQLRQHRREFEKKVLDILYKNKAVQRELREWVKADIEEPQQAVA